VQPNPAGFLFHTAHGPRPAAPARRCAGIVRIDLQQVDAPCGALASRQYQAADAVIKRIGTLALTHSNPRMPCKISALPASSVDSLPLVD
jgi:hypothetical protein